MKTKRILLTLILGILLISLISAQNYKLEVATTSENFDSGQPITLKVSLLDENNNPVYDRVEVILEDSSKNQIKETINSNELVSIYFERATFGQGIITAKYGDISTTGIFFINANENIEFALGENLLTITNLGNTRYIKPIQIVIGEYVGEEQTLDLNIGESKNFKLVAPEGTYNLKVIVNGEILFSKREVPLSSEGFTGEAIGAIDESSTSRSGLTGGISPDQENHEAILGYLKNSKISYIFIIAVFGTAILLAIERRFRKKADK